MFLEKLSAAWPAERWRDVTVLVAVSGGADSVALTLGLHALLDAQATGRLILAHFNHKLRGPESDADEEFVKALANQLGLTPAIGAATNDLAAGGSGEGIEGAARQARYDFLSRAAAENGARYIATAHTADDQAETVLFHVLRGTGLGGLSGIPRIRQLDDAATIIRPMLEVSRAEVLEYLQSLGQTYRDDSSNRQEEFTRNRIRRQLMPLLEREFNPHVREALQRLARIAGQADDFLKQQAEAALVAAARRIERGVELDVRRTAFLHPALVRQMLLVVWQEQDWPLQDMSHEKWEELRAMIQDSQVTARATLPGNVRALREGDRVRLQR